MGRVEQTESPCVINSPSPRHHVFPRRQIDFNQVTIRRCQPNGLGNQLDLMSQVNNRRCQMALPMTFPIPFSPHLLIVSQYRFASFGGFLVQLSSWDMTEDGTEQLLELEAGLLS